MICKSHTNSWSHKPKICKTSIFHELLFPKYIFKIISADDICLSVCLSRFKWTRLNNERKKIHKMLQLVLSYTEIHLKKLYGPFLWVGFICLKARATSRSQFTFYHKFPEISGTDFIKLGRMKGWVDLGTNH